jgi:arsenite methyltransferase
VAERDRWSSWLASFRTSGDHEVQRKGVERLQSWRDAILDGAYIAQGEALLDVGCGEGLVGFGALERGASTVVFSDISQDLLDFCRNAARELDVLDRSRFVRASAEELAGIGDESVDVVTTRSVLIYVADKQAAFGEFFRVLKPGGRISLFEPINRFARTETDTWAGYDLTAIPEISRKIRALYEHLQPRASDPMLDFDERDLVAFARRAGFFPVLLRLEAEVRAPDPASWETFVGLAQNPCVPPLQEAMDEALTPDEREQLTAHLRPLVEEGRGVSRTALAYLVGVKPSGNGALARAS